MSRPPRVSGFSYLGLHRYFLTICALNRRAVFADDVVARSTIDQFLQTATKEAFVVLAYCLMPDHFHLLVEGTEDRSDLRRFVKMGKQRAGSKFSREHSARLWQEGYFDRVLRREEDSYAVARYIVENPVRAGLVNSPAHYPYLGSEVWTVEQLMEAAAASVWRV
jgi:REP-associated tyrosine transposase